MEQRMTREFVNEKRIAIRTEMIRVLVYALLCFVGAAVLTMCKDFINGDMSCAYLTGGIGVMFLFYASRLKALDQRLSRWQAWEYEKLRFTAFTRRAL